MDSNCDRDVSRTDSSCVMVAVILDLHVTRKKATDDRGDREIRKERIQTIVK